MDRQRLRIALDARYLRRAGVGISAYLVDFIAELAEDDFDLTLLTNDPAHAATLAHAYVSCQVVDLCDRREITWEQRALPRYLREATPEIYVAGANRGLPTRSPHATKLALIVHDLIPLRMPRTHLLSDPFGASRFLFGTLVSIARADLIIANSHSTSRDVRHLRPNVRATVRYPSIPTPASTDSGKPKDWPEEFLLYCGGADSRKNLKGLVAAHAEYRRKGDGLPLVVIGSGFDDRKADLLRISSVDALIFTGLVPDAVKWWAIRTARAVLYPSTWEGFGLPILEALAVGTPVLAGRGGAQPEVGGNAVVYVDVHDHEALLAGIDEVISASWRGIVRQAGPAQVHRIRVSHQTAGQVLRMVYSD